MGTDDTLQLDNGVRMPRLIYGTAWKKDKTAACVRTALSLGFRGIDTACQPKHYDEAAVGDGTASFLKASGGAVGRDRLYLQTKFTPVSGQDPSRIPYDARVPLAEQVLQSLNVSLRNLQTDYLDCLVLHSPFEDARSMETAWRAMESLVDSGRVRQLGLSNCYDVAFFKDLHRWARIKPAVLQNRFYAVTGFDIALRAFCRERGIVYQSFWTLTANPNLLSSAPIQSLASAYRRTPAQILFRYLTQEGVTPLTGTQSAIHMREDLAIFEFGLSDADRTAIANFIAS